MGIKVKVSSTKAGKCFGSFLEVCKKEPVHITHYRRQVATLLSASDYERFLDVDNRFWGELAVLAEKVGFPDDVIVRQWLMKKTGYALNLTISKVALEVLETIPTIRCENILNDLLDAPKDPTRRIKKLQGYKFRRCDFGKYRVIFDVVNGTIQIFYVGEQGEEK